MKALVGAFNQEKALVGAFSVIVKTGCGTDGALHSTSHYGPVSPGLVFPICTLVTFVSSLAAHSSAQSQFAVPFQLWKMPHASADVFGYKHQVTVTMQWPRIWTRSINIMY